jgi:monoterpene epsilon-lactone hydrolase
MRRPELRLPPPAARLTARPLSRYVLTPDLPWDVQRRRLDRVMGSSPLPRGTAIEPVLLDGVPAEVVTAREACPGVTVLHFHGGGYCVGSARIVRAWAARLSRLARCRVVLPDYRLAPEHPHPAALDDAGTALAALLSTPASSTASSTASSAVSSAVAPASVVVSGDSAGGGLALALLLARRQAGQALPAGAMLLAPWLDLTVDRRAAPELVRRDTVLSPAWLEACAAAYAGSANRADPAVSPLLAGAAGLPPLLVQSGSDDLLAPDAGRLAVTASAAGVDVTYTRWPGLGHDFVLQPGLLAAADSALAQAAWFVAEVTASAAATRADR